MLVAFAGCWHANIQAALSAIEACHEAGVKTIVHTGDFLYTDPVASRFLKSLEYTLRQFDMRIVVVRGNHDNPAIFADSVTQTNLKREQGIVYTDGFARLTPHILHAPDGLRWAWEGVTFGALGGAHSVDWRRRKSGTSWWIDEQTPFSAVEAIKSAGHTDVLIMHDVPSGVPLRGFDGIPGDPEWDVEGAAYHRIRLRDAVDAATPQYVISGHMHTRQTEFITLNSGHSVKSIILDRADYPGRIGSPDVLSRNILLLDVEDGQISMGY